MDKYSELKPDRAKISVEKNARLQRLIDRQNELGGLIKVNPELLRGVGFCQSCDGRGQLLETSVGRVAITGDGRSTPLDSAQIKKCEECGGLGLEFGDLDLTAQEWVSLSRNNVYGIRIEANGKKENRHKPSPTVSENKPLISDEEKILLDQIRLIEACGQIPGKPRQRGRFSPPDIKTY